MKRLLTSSLLACCLIAPIAQASNCQVHFTIVDGNVQRALTIGSTLPQWQAREQMCERLNSFGGAINVAGGFSTGAGTVSYFVHLTVGERVTGFSIPDHGINFVMSGRFPDAKTESELIGIAIPAFRGTTKKLLQNWYESGGFEKAVEAFLNSRNILNRR